MSTRDLNLRLQLLQVEDSQSVFCLAAYTPTAGGCSKTRRNRCKVCAFQHQLTRVDVELSRSGPEMTLLY